MSTVDFLYHKIRDRAFYSEISLPQFPFLLNTDTEWKCQIACYLSLAFLSTRNHVVNVSSERAVQEASILEENS